MRKKLTESEINELQNVFITSGAIAFGKELIEKYAQQAEDILEKIHFDNEESKLDIQMLITQISHLKM